MTMLGRYRIDGRLGEGAMADVYRAFDPGIGRTVAIKVLKPELARDPSLGQRFLREARAAGALSHPHIATIYDVGEADGAAYIAMELVDGRPLDVVLAEGRMPYERVLSLGSQLADALAYAHRAGIVHRDVKPSNILLSADGRTAKLLDFGVARVGETTHGLARTQAGQLDRHAALHEPGSRRSVDAVDHRADLFSLGVVLYEMVTGKVAFPGHGARDARVADRRRSRSSRSRAPRPTARRACVSSSTSCSPRSRRSASPMARRLHAALLREAAAANEAPARHGLSLRLKLPLALVGVTAAALVASVSAMLAREERTLEHMAIVSGRVDRGVRHRQCRSTRRRQRRAGARAAGLVRAPGLRGPALPAIPASATWRSSTPAGSSVPLPTRGGSGRRYAAPTGESRVSAAGEAAVTAAADDGRGAGLRFVRPIRYAGADFGTVDLVLRRTALDAALANARALLIALALVVIVVAGLVGWLGAFAVARPLKRLRDALDAAAESGFALAPLAPTPRRIRRRLRRLQPRRGCDRAAARERDAADRHGRDPDRTERRLLPPRGRLMYMLQLFDAEDAVEPCDVRLLRDGTLRIGRDRAADWSIADPDCALSRTHCELTASSDGLTLRALGSNGVFDAGTGERMPDAVDAPVCVPGSLRMGRFRLVATRAALPDIPADTGTDDDLTAPLGSSTQVPTDWAEPAPDAPPVTGSLLEAFCQGAGLDASLLSSEPPEEIMRRAGAVYRQMVLGIGDLMAERDRARARYQLTKTTIGGTDNNPFKWAPTPSASDRSAADRFHRLPVGAGGALRLVPRSQAALGCDLRGAAGFAARRDRAVRSRSDRRGGGRPCLAAQELGPQRRCRRWPSVTPISLRRSRRTFRARSTARS